MLNHNWFNYKSGKKLTKLQNFLVYPFSNFLFRLLVLLSFPLGFTLAIIDLFLLPIHGIIYLIFGKSISILGLYLDFINYSTKLNFSLNS